MLHGRVRLAALIAIGALGVAIFAVVEVRSGGRAGPVATVSTGPEIAALDTDQPFGLGRVSPLRFRWPVKPFDHAHALRATFGEPRGLGGVGGPRGGGVPRADYLAGLGQIAAIGHRGLHTGIDIVAADGTPVYAVRSGIARAGGAGYEAHVIVGDFGYWHLAGAVPTGTRVVAFQTILGHVYPGQGHVHLTRFAAPDRGDPADDPVNPLLAGGITPYSDSAPPVLGELKAFDTAQRPIPTDALSGPVVLAVRASDVQSAGGAQTGLYSLSYRLVDAAGRPAVGPTGVFAFDVLPVQGVARRLYTASSTRHRFEADFWYRITDRTPSDDGFFHTEQVSPGRYTLEVVASDARANTTRRSYALTVLAAARQ